VTTSTPSRTGVDDEVLSALEDAVTYDDFDAITAEYGHLSPDEQQSVGPSPSDLENTYLNAKNSANDVGDNSAAAEFFILEMRYRR
jgi:hypothetical protein